MTPPAVLGISRRLAKEDRSRHTVCSDGSGWTNVFVDVVLWQAEGFHGLIEPEAQCTVRRSCWPQANRLERAIRPIIGNA